MIELDVAAAYQRIRPHIRRTPLLQLSTGEIEGASAVELKLEFVQHAGSFKARGAFNALLCQTIPRSGVTAASGGNHGVAVAFAAAQLGLKARIFVPEIASPTKIAAIRAHGAEIVIGGSRYADAQEACDRYAQESGALTIHPFSAVPTLAGAATVALEWQEQHSGDGALADTVLVAVGGGGLLAGMASYWRATSIKLVGVEPIGSRALGAALEAGGPVDVMVESIAADSLGARNVGPLVYSIVEDAKLSVVTVEDTAIIDAQRWAWRALRIALEPGGATALAALRSGAYRPAPGERVGILLCGANVEPTKLPL